MLQALSSELNSLCLLKSTRGMNTDMRSICGLLEFCSSSCSTWNSLSVTCLLARNESALASQQKRRGTQEGSPKLQLHGSSQKNKEEHSGELHSGDGGHVQADILAKPDKKDKLC